MMNLNDVIDTRVTEAADYVDLVHRTTPLGGVPKRVFDIAVASLMLVCLAPLMMMVVAIIWTTDRGSIIFGHSRIGFGGRSFKCLKFRTMVPNSADVLRELLETDPGAAREWAETQKLREDPRITAVGGVLRKLSVDELPQLFNVIKGEMSLVGPRPIVRAEVERYGSMFRSYVAARPGITGLWQVSGRSDSSYDQRVAFDAQYEQSWSLWRDLEIMVRTAFVVVLRKGSY